MKESPYRLETILLDGYRPLRDLVFEALKDAILTQKLHPGERLLESELADELGVSPHSRQRGYPQTGAGGAGRDDPPQRRLCRRHFFKGHP